MEKDADESGRERILEGNVMATVEKTQIIEIGDSWWIRIPKLWFEQMDLRDEVELELQENRILIRPARQARADWGDRFHTMAEHGDDQLLDSEIIATTAWDEGEWEW